MKVLRTSQPIFSVYNWHSNLQSIILDHPDALPWIYSNYIQIYMDTRPEITFADFYLNNGLIHTASCPFIRLNSMSHQVIKKLASFTDFFKKCIEDEYYIYVNVDVSKISKYSRNTISYHELFIYGFDSSKDIFFVADYINGSFTKFTVTFKEIESAVESTININPDHHLADIEMWKYLEEARYSFDISNVKEQLYEYVNSINSSLRYKNKVAPHPNRCFGLNVYDTVLNHLTLVQAGRKIDIRPFHLFYERSKLMCNRMQYMEEIDVIKNAENYVSVYKNFTAQFLKIRNLVIKYQLTNNQLIISKIINEINQIYSGEKHVVEKLIKDII